MNSANNPYKNILVCVTQQKTCSRLIKIAASMRQKETNLYVLHVTKNDWNFLNNIREGEALDYLFVISKTVGADLTVLRSDHIPEAIGDFAHNHEIDVIVLGESPDNAAENQFHKRLRKLTKGIEIKVIPQ